MVQLLVAESALLTGFLRERMGKLLQRITIRKLKACLGGLIFRTGLYELFKFQTAREDR